MSALRTALRPALTPALGSARRGVSRYFTTFDSVAQSYVSFPTVVLTVGQPWVITYEGYIPSQGTYLFSDRLSTIATDRALVTSGGSIGGLSDVSPVIEGDIFPLVTPAALNKIEISSDGSLITWVVNGVFFVSYGVGGSSPKLNAIGAQYSGVTSVPFLNGIASNISIEVNGSEWINYPISRYYTPQNNIVLDESGNGNNGTFVNVAAGDSKYYQQRADGNFVDLQGNVLEVAY